MISARQLASSLWGVWLLLRWDTSAFAFFERNFAGFCRSYIVAIAFAPISAALWVISFDPGTAKIPFAVHFFTEAISYVMGWTAYPLAMIYILRLIERDNRYFDYMVLYNWLQAPLMVLSLTVSAFNDFGFLSAPAASFLGLITLGVFFAYGIFLARAALMISGLQALALVLLDIFLSILIRQLVSRA